MRKKSRAEESEKEYPPHQIITDYEGNTIYSGTPMLVEDKVPDKNVKVILVYSLNKIGKAVKLSCEVLERGERIFNIREQSVVPITKNIGPELLEHMCSMLGLEFGIRPKKR